MYFLVVDNTKLTFSVYLSNILNTVIIKDFDYDQN